ncbi:heavy metal translocating P-type ATPase [Flavobacterium muglaense]|uniref:P-type Zn(2+) transporter n=1 Tax=Flavobacterium muglaense TaxID=2764716 RepID=A0A923N0V9_9FLAO|nr:cation-translocating P-type ATPase [Flavobacterium muglaense]MBC5838206.1 cation-translocating P-type ATPase [Flavobacterium muglaense]MBC5844710.1 cation-translocating P-type ATPase [Flavobacterium muglaense]
MKLPIKDKKFIFLFFAVTFVIVLEILSLLGIDIPMPYSPIVFTFFIFGIGHEVLLNGVKAIFKLKFSSINLLMTIAVVAAFYLGEYPEAAVVIVLYVLGERLEDIGLDNSKSALDELIHKVPKSAFVKLEQLNIPIDKITIGTTIQVKPGEMIPLDGKIITGDTLIDEASITGEPLAKDKHPGDIVFAGTLNQHGFIEIRTTKLSTDTTFSKIIQLTFEASASKSETQKFIQTFSQYYTPTVIGLAFFVLIVPVFILHLDFDHWLKQAITLLVIACPCALVISTPVAIYAAIGNASAKGILVKGGKYIEAMANLKAIALDKTRTITYGNPIVTDVFPLNGTSREELLACTAGTELLSEHPLAQAIVTASIKEGFEPHQAEGLISHLGKGAIATCLVCKKESVFVGKLDFIKKYHEVPEEAEKIVQQLATEGKTSVVISFGDGVAGIIGLTDEIKPDSIKAIKQLQAMNLELIILSGDNKKAAYNVAKQVGIEKIYGDLLPEDKSNNIKELIHQFGDVAMVGDGINDAPALAQSTVGIAMGAAGSDTAIETANIALLNDNLSLIPFLIRLSKRTLNRIKINTIGAISVKIFFITLAFLGYSNLVFAIAADVGVTLIVILSSLSLMNFENVDQ